MIADLDLLRDTVIDANAQTPPLVSTATTRKVVTYHRSAIIFVHEAPEGWQAAVDVGLTEVARNLPANEAQIISPYVNLIHAVLSKVK